MKNAWFAVSLVSMLPVSLVVACTTANGSSEQEQGLGTVEMAISTTGPDGATYSLSPSTYLALAQNGALVTCRQLASTPTQTLDLPAGAYQAALSLSQTCAGTVFGPSDAGSSGKSFTLTRTTDGGFTSVPALLQNPTQNLTVAAGGTASLVFSFSIEQLGTVTMGTGATTVSIATGDAGVTVAPTKGTLTEPLVTVSELSGPAGMPAVDALLSPSCSPNVTVSLGSLSTFVANANDQACATFIPLITASGSVSVGYAALLQELSAPGASGTLCFIDPNGQQGYATAIIQFARTGAPVTSQFQAALAGASGDAGATVVTFTGQFGVETATYFYNGSTLTLGSLVTPVAFSAGGSSVGLQTISGSVIATVDGSPAALACTISLSP